LQNGKVPVRAIQGSILVRRRVPGMAAAQLGRFVARARSLLGISGGVNILLAGNRELRALNRRFRGKDTATDVLSFPPLSVLRGSFAGDLAISADLAIANGRRLGHSAPQEVKILALHGLLHLAGHDHEHDRGEMARKELRLRKSLGLPIGLIERNGKPAKLPPAKSKRMPRTRGLARTR
jgi:probable rRNA maturation factor